MCRRRGWVKVAVRMWVRGVALVVAMNLGGAMPVPSLVTPTVLDKVPASWAATAGNAAYGGTWLAMLPLFAMMGLCLRMSRTSDEETTLL